MDDPYTQGYTDAEQRYLLMGYVDYSQGNTDYDLGWNAFVAQSRLGLIY